MNLYNNDKNKKET